MTNLGYCVKCRKKQEIKEPKEVAFEVKGKTKYAIQGICPICGTKITRFIAKGEEV